MFALAVVSRLLDGMASEFLQMLANWWLWFFRRHDWTQSTQNVESLPWPSIMLKTSWELLVLAAAESSHKFVPSLSPDAANRSPKIRNVGNNCPYHLRRRGGADNDRGDRGRSELASEAQTAHEGPRRRRLADFKGQFPF